MLQTDMKLTGDLDGALARFEVKVREKVLRAGSFAMSDVVYHEVRANAARHIDKGTLYNAIYQVHADQLSNDDKQTYRISWNKRKAPHGHLIEWGTSRAPAYPFVRPAFDHIGAAIKAGQEKMAETLRDAT